MNTKEQINNHTNFSYTYKLIEAQKHNRTKTTRGIGERQTTISENENSSIQINHERDSTAQFHSTPGEIRLLVKYAGKCRISQNHSKKIMQNLTTRTRRAFISGSNQNRSRDFNIKTSSATKRPPAQTK